MGILGISTVRVLNSSNGVDSALYVGQKLTA